MELDNSTETQVYRRLRSNTIEQKIRRYERLHYELASEQHASPFRVLFVCTRSRLRAENILRTARRVVREPRRSIFYSVLLDDYLRSDDPLHASLFRDQQASRVALLPPPMSLPVQETCGVGEWWSEERSPSAGRSVSMASVANLR